jgi:hypothetical protein
MSACAPLEPGCLGQPFCSESVQSLTLTVPRDVAGWRDPTWRAMREVEYRQSFVEYGVNV